MTYSSDNPEFSRVSYDTFSSANLPTTDPEGTVYFDSQRGVPAWWDGSGHEWATFVDDVLITPQTVSNTTTRTEVWNPDINAGSLIQGRTYLVSLQGIFSTTNNSDTFNVIVDVAGEDVATMQNAPANVTDDPWSMDVEFTVRSHGSNGTLKANTVGLFAEQPRSESHAEQSVDTTSATNLSVDIDWDQADAANTATIEQAHLEQMG